MEINIDTGTASKDELTALIALCASLGGRLTAAAIFPLGATADTAKAVGVVLDPAAQRDPAMPELREAADEGDEQEDAPADGTLDPTKLDTSGVPWDARIHSTPASINKSDGTYRKKRKVNEVYFGQVHGELAEQHASPNLGTGTTTTGAASPASGTADEQIAPPPPADDEAPPPPVDGPNEGQAASALTVDQSGASAAAENATGAGRFAGFPEFISAVNAIRPAPGIPFAELNTLAATVGVPGGFKDMRLHSELWEDFFALAGGQ